MRNLKLCAAALTAVVCLTTITPAIAQQRGEQMVDAFANVIVDTITSSSCEDLAARMQQSRSNKNNPMRARVMQMLQKNPNLRRQLVNRIAAPVANKMLDCNLVPGA